MPPSNDLPAWLRASGGRRRDDQRHPGLMAALALLLFAAGGGAGYGLALRRSVPPAPAAPPVCPPAVACITPPASTGGGGATGASRARHAKTVHPATTALVPLPEGKPLEEGERKKALFDFAANRAPELRDCLDDPDHGPRQELGAAFEIDPNGSVEVVQILGADGASREVRRCYSAHLKKWRFPKDLLRGEEKLLVNFVL